VARAPQKCSPHIGDSLPVNGDGSQWIGHRIMVPSSLRLRIGVGMLLVLVPVLLVGLYAIPVVWRLGTALRAILAENYITIQSVQHMQSVLRDLQMAELEGYAKTAEPGLRDEFFHWLDFELHSLTEIGEPETARDVEVSADLLFSEIENGPPGVRHDEEFSHLIARTNFLIRLNEMAMWRNDARLRYLSEDVATTLILSYLAAVVLGVGLTWTISKTIARPLVAVAAQLADVGEDLKVGRLGPQTLRELQTVAASFNQMADRLEHYQLLNVDRLLFEKNKIEAIIHHMESGLLLLDSEGSIAHINEVAGIVLGVDDEDAIAQPFQSLPTTSLAYQQICEALLKIDRTDHLAHPLEVEVHMRGRDHNFLVLFLHLSKGKDALGTLLTFQDVTYVRDQDRARRNLVATLSHELRTPLTSLGLAAQILDRKMLDQTGEGKELMHTILLEFSRLSELIDELLDVSRQPVQSMRLRQVRFSLARILDEFRKRFAIQAEEKGIRFEVQASALPDIHGDPVKISWVLSNLITNALRYTPSGGTVEVLARAASSDSIRLEVRDTGPGIPPEVREHIFDRFAQYVIDGRPPGSAGLGLAIAKEMVNAHGGRIFVESEVGVGSRFIVELPIGSETLMTA
jgi:two-component system, NtrC family, sensor histidine kinase KinB